MASKLKKMQTTIHLELRRLIDAKSKRDKVSFTACQLAHALGMPRSMITKLTHPDETKRVTNPRVDTLMKIVDFFRADGFAVSIEDLLGRETRVVEVREQLVPQNRSMTVPIYSLDTPDDKLGKVAIKISVNHNKILGFRTSKAIKPFFKIGSIFIVDPAAELEDDVLVAVKLASDGRIDIKKYKKNSHKVMLESLDNKDKSIHLLPTSQIVIVGVVVQINAQA
jgi:hypothetical protein